MSRGFMSKGYMEFNMKQFQVLKKKKIREEKEEISIYICCQQKGSLSKLRENRENFQV